MSEDLSRHWKAIPVLVVFALFMACGSSCCLVLVLYPAPATSVPKVQSPEPPETLPERLDRTPPAPSGSHPSLQLVAHALEVDACDLPSEAGWTALDRRAVAEALGTRVEGSALAAPSPEGHWRRWVEEVGLVSLRWGPGGCVARRVDATLVEIDAEGADVVSGCGPIRRLHGAEDRFVVRWVQPTVDSCRLIALWLGGDEAFTSVPVELTAARGERRTLRLVPDGPAPPEFDNLETILGSTVLSDLVHVDAEDTGE